MEAHDPLNEVQEQSLLDLGKALTSSGEDPFFGLIMVDHPTETAGILEQLAGSTPAFQHVLLDLTERQIDSLANMIRERLGDLISAENASSYLVHIVMAEGSFVEEFLQQTSVWVPQLNDDRDSLFRGFPMKIVLWGLPYTVSRIEAEAAPFWEELPNAFDFRTEDASLEPFPTMQNLANEIHDTPSPSAYYGLGKAIGEIGLVKNAIGCMNQVLELEEKDPSLQGKAKFQLGSLLLAEQQTSAALTHYQEALDLLPETEEKMRNAAYFEMARVYRQGGDANQGIKLLQKGLAEQSKPLPRARFQRRLAALYRRKGQLDKALTLFETAAQIFETESEAGLAAEAWQQVAGLHQDQLKPAEALLAFQKALPLAQKAEDSFMIMAVEDSIEALEERTKKESPKKSGKGLFGRLFGGK